MKRNCIVRNITVEKLIYGGNGLAVLDDGMKVIISWGAIPGSIIDIRILKNKKTHYLGQIQKVIQPSPLEQKLPSDHQLYWGCKWLPIPYEDQLEIKQEQVIEAFHHVADKPWMSEAIFKDIQRSPQIYWYRNKLEFSWGKYISAKQEIHEQYRFWFHEQGSFDRIIDCSNCVLADEMVNTIFHQFDEFARASWLPTYDQKVQQGFWRHLVFRQAKNTNQLMVIVSVHSGYLWDDIQDFIQSIKEFASNMSDITSLYLLHNSWKADIVDGEFQHISWEKNISEKLIIDEKEFYFVIAPRSFFQTNTLGAQDLYSIVRKNVWKDNHVLLDLYAWTGTIGIILSDLAKKVYSVELVTSSSEDNKRNLSVNKIDNVSVINQKVEEFLVSEETKKLISAWLIDTIIIDPPRAGMHTSAPSIIPDFQAKKIIYVSCNPATLVRDLEKICEEWSYQITSVQWVDMFPHTHHIEVVVVLEIRDQSS